MIKIKSIQFKKYPVLGDLCLDFCDNNGNPADTIIIAGENGTGKTIILEQISKIMKYEMVQYDTDCEVELNILDNNGENFKYNYHYEGDRLYFPDHLGVSINNNQDSTKQENLYRLGKKFSSIYSNVNINFSPNLKIRTIQSNSEDAKNNDDLNENMAKNIKQFLINTDNYDNKIIVDKIRENVGKIVTEEMLQGRMDRFKKAFNVMFSNIIEYNGMEDKNDYIEILFNKNGKEFSIDNLSSGEKQIVFRGAFLLKDKEALNGAVILIDEPEISMHPKWQKKILDYYRNLFIDSNGKQTSQIIVSTHSNFVIENAVQKLKQQQQQQQQQENIVIICLKKNNQVTKITRNGNPFILPTVTAAEINYHVFNIASIDYHIQLFGHLQNLMENILSKNIGRSININIEQVDKNIKHNKSLLPYYYDVEADSNLNICQWKYKNTTYNTICCFIRNAIDHPDNLSTQTKKEYTENDLQYSIEILIELINLEKSGKLAIII